MVVPRGENPYRRDTMSTVPGVTRIVIADGYALMLAGVCAVFDDVADIEVVGAATTVAETRRMIAATQPDIVITDLRLADGSCRALADELMAQAQHPRIILLTSFATDDTVHEAICRGASGYLLKSLSSHALVDAVRAVANGGSVADPTIVGHLFDLVASIPLRADYRHDQLAALTEREVSVLREIALGHNNHAIATHLGIGGSTLKTHIGNLFRKLGVADRAGAVRVAFNSGLVQPDGSR